MEIRLRLSVFLLFLMPYTLGLTQTSVQLDQFQDIMELSEMSSNSMGSDKVDQASQDEIQDNNNSQNQHTSIIQKRKHISCNGTCNKGT